MTLPLTNEFHEKAQTMFPVLALAEETINEVMGISLDDLRYGNKSQTNAMARTIFVRLCREHVRPSYYLSSYINHSHSMISYWDRIFDDLFETYAPFKMIAKRANKVFNQKIEDGDI